MLRARSRLIALIICLFTGLVGCSSHQTMPAAQTQNPGSSLEPGSYRIGVGDSLEIRVWKEPELSVDSTVRPDGIITVPLAGDMQAAGLTSDELKTALQAKLGKYVNNPQISVIVSNPQSAQFQHRVRVTGAVAQPMSAPWQEGMTILDLILLSGGLTDFASPNKAVLYRRVDGELKSYTVRLGDILNKGKLQTNYPLAPSDIVTVPERLF